MIQDYEQRRPLLLAAGEPALTAAVERYDAALAAVETAQRGVRQPGERRQEAEQAYRAESLAAALEHREPTLDASSLTAADEADVEQATRIATAEQVRQRREAELHTAIGDHQIALAHVVAGTRDQGARSDPNHDNVPRWLNDFFNSLGSMPFAYWPAVVTWRGFSHFSLVLGGWNQLAHLSRPSEQYSHNEHVWAQLAIPKRKGFDVTAEGTIMLRQQWTAPDGRQPIWQGAVVRSYGPHVHMNDRGTSYEAGTLVWRGTGPNGEQGVTVDDLLDRFATRLD